MEQEEIEQCLVCKLGVDEEGEQIHWWKQENPQCPVVIARNQRDEDDYQRNEFYR